MDGKGVGTQEKEVKGPGKDESDDGWVKRGDWRVKVAKGASRDSLASLRRSRIEWLSSTGTSRTYSSQPSQLQPHHTTSSLATISPTLTSRELASSRTTSTKWLPSTSATESQEPLSEFKRSLTQPLETTPSTLWSSTSSPKPPLSSQLTCDKCGHSLMQEEDWPTPSEESDSEDT